MSSKLRRTGFRNIDNIEVPGSGRVKDKDRADESEGNIREADKNKLTKRRVEDN